MRTKFRFETLKGRNHSEDLVVDGMKLFKWTLRKEDMGMWTGFIWLRIGIDGGIL
jgi:hypothetical protein